MQHKQATFDGWTIAHAVSGFMLAAFGIGRPLAYTLIVGTEIVESILRKRGVDFFEETTENVVADLAVGIAAYELTRGGR